MLHLFTGINKFDFKDRRFALAEKLATQGPILGLPGLKSGLDKKQREHCVIVRYHPYIT